MARNDEDRVQRQARQEERLREDMQRRADRQKQRAEKPFVRGVVVRLFILELLLTVGFGLLELVQAGQPGYAVAPRAAFGSLLAGGLMPGVPLLVLCIVQWVRIHKGICKEKPDTYYIAGGTTLGLLAVLLVCFLVALLVA